MPNPIRNGPFALIADNRADASKPISSRNKREHAHEQVHEHLIQRRDKFYHPSVVTDDDAANHQKNARSCQDLMQ